MADTKTKEDTTTTQPPEVTQRQKVLNEKRDATAAEVVRLRDEERLSWAIIGFRVGPVSAGTARRLYTEATGESHTEAKPVVSVNSVERTGGTAKKGGKRKSVEEPVFTEDTTEEEALKALKGASTIVIENSSGSHKYPVHKDSEVEVREGKRGLYLYFVDNEGKARTPGLANVTRIIK